MAQKVQEVADSESQFCWALSEHESLFYFIKLIPEDTQVGNLGRSRFLVWFSSG